jgi:hypothetical protein
MIGGTEGYADDLLKALSNSSQWATSDTSSYDPSSTLTEAFIVLVVPDEDLSDETDDDDDATLVKVSVLVMVCLMLLLFLGVCAHTVRARRLEALASPRSRTQKDRRYGSSAAGKVSLLDLSDQRASDLLRAAAAAASTD